MNGKNSLNSNGHSCFCLSLMVSNFSKLIGMTFREKFWVTNTRSIADSSKVTSSMLRNMQTKLAVKQHVFHITIAQYTMYVKTRQERIVVQ